MLNNFTFKNITEGEAHEFLMGAFNTQLQSVANIFDNSDVMENTSLGNIKIEKFNDGLILVTAKDYLNEFVVGHLALLSNDDILGSSLKFEAKLKLWDGAVITFKGSHLVELESIFRNEKVKSIVSFQARVEGYQLSYYAIDPADTVVNDIKGESVLMDYIKGFNYIPWDKCRCKSRHMSNFHNVQLELFDDSDNMIMFATVKKAEEEQIKPHVSVYYKNEVISRDIYDIKDFVKSSKQFTKDNWSFIRLIYGEYCITVVNELAKF